MRSSRDNRTDWNAVLLTGPGVVMKAVAALRPLGVFRPSPHGGVAVGKIEAADVLAAATRLCQAEPERFEHVQRLLPIDAVVRFEHDDVTEALCHALEHCGPKLVGKRFYVRCRLRGMDSRLESRAVERAIGSYLWELSGLVGKPASVSFDDPDLVVNLEVIGSTVGYSFFGADALSSALVRPR